jgi:hypothetical protein
MKDKLALILQGITATIVVIFLVWSIIASSSGAVSRQDLYTQGLQIARQQEQIICLLLIAPENRNQEIVEACGFDLSEERR